MKKLISAKVILLLIFAISLTACKKSADSKINEFIQGYNSATANISRNNPVIASSSAEKTGPNEITISIKTTTGSDEMESQLMKSSFPQLIGQLLNSSSPKSNLMDEGINFKVNVFDKNGNKLVSQALDKNTIGKSSLNVENFANGNSPSQSELNELLSVFNKNLPITDPSTGIKILKMEAGSENDIVYHAEVPDELKEVLKMDGAKQLMKDEMLRQPQLRQILSQTSKLGIDKLRYLYKDKAGNLIEEITLNQSDLK